MISINTIVLNNTRQEYWEETLLLNPSHISMVQSYGNKPYHLEVETIKTYIKVFGIEEEIYTPYSIEEISEIIKRSRYN